MPLDIESHFTEWKIQLVRDWIEGCAIDSECSKISKSFLPPFLPTRLLDIGSKAKNESFIKLIDSKTLDLSEEVSAFKYICLSYCWGPDSAGQLLKTTVEMVEEYKKQIPIDIKMPLVFRDAILVARELGVRYLWIDALCIIQEGDDGQDWAKQSTMMGDIFSYAWLTIAAAATSSCHDSLFPPRYNPSIEVPFKSSINPDISGNISIILIHKQLYSPIENPFGEDIYSSTWNTRGWVWQEQSLAQRLLIFGKTMLHFRCHCRHFSEYGDRHKYIAYSAPFETLLLNRRPSTFDWKQIIESYTQRSLTKSHDRLAAISGYVKLMAKRLKDFDESGTYLAGIWLSARVDLDRQLRWVTSTPILSYTELLQAHLDSDTYIAPTWSWASLNQSVSFLLFSTFTIETAFQLIAHTIEPASKNSDVTISIKPGSSITLSGKLRNIPRGPYTIEESSSNRKVVNQDFVMDEPHKRESVEGFMKNDWISYYTDWDPSLDDFDGRIMDDNLTLFQTCVETVIHCPKASGLMLLPVEGGNTRLFRRVGAFEIWGPLDSPEWKETEVVII
ncbi:hypothetical protein NHQ30_000872 [Ciborinia camelliae]|nr:hypothetical protein NHQ30_000872 [Ciborinia camelliae]